MKSILIISLGTRDIKVDSSILENESFASHFEVKKDFKDSSSLYLHSPRQGGAFIDKQFDLLNSFLRYPICKPSIDYVIDKFGRIDKVLLIATDQSRTQGIEDYHINNDTVEVAKVLKKLILRDYKSHEVGKIKLLVVDDPGVIYYDRMYDYFAAVLPRELEDHVFLSLQGGIDAINTTILLKSIEYRENVEQLAKPEGTDFAFSLQFPSLFRKNFQRQKAIHSVNNYNYPAVIELQFSFTTTKLARYALARVAFNFELARKHLLELLTVDTEHRTIFQAHLKQLQFDGSFKDRQREVYLSAKLSLRHHAYADFLAKMFTMSETLLKPIVADILGGEIVFNAAEQHAKWNRLLNEHLDIVTHLEKCTFNGRPLQYKFPNRYAYKEIYFYHLQNNDLEPDSDLKVLLRLLEKLVDLRNKSVHSLGEVSLEAINECLIQEKCTIEDLIVLTDRFFGVQGMGVYDEINDIFKSLLQ